MATVRLTKTMREEILRALHDRAFKQERAALLEREHALALQIYDDAYTAEQQAHMNALPGDFFRQYQCVKAGLPGMKRHDFYLPDREPIPLKHEYNCIISYQQTDPRMEAIDQFMRDEEELGDKRQAAQAEAEATLEACSSVKKLIEVWPDIEPLLDTLGIKKEAGRTMLPAVQRELNSVFELPPETKPAEGKE